MKTEVGNIMNKGTHDGSNMTLPKIFDTKLYNNFTKRQKSTRLVQTNTCFRHNNHGGLS